MKTHWWAVVLIISTTIFTTLAQYFFKIGAESLVVEFTVPGLKALIFSAQILTLWPIVAGFASYGVGAVLMILAFKGGDATVVYPIVATSYVWVVLMSAFVFDEPLNAFKIAGSLVLVIGIFFVAKGSRADGVISEEVPL